MLTAGIPTAPPRIHSLALIAAGFLALLALAWLAWSASTRTEAPHPVHATQPAVNRMLRHVAVLAAAPRPIATGANAEARDYIVGQLRGMGLAPLVQKTTVQKSVIQYWGGTHVTLGVVQNIVVRLPGSAPDRLRRPALLLATHYDTRNTTLGAARPAAQVAALIETARALLSAPASGTAGGSAHANDIVLLFADGENVGGLGAKGFAEQHPWARQVGLALKFDSAGSSGAPILYDSAGAPGAVLRALDNAVPGISGSSLMARLVKLLPDTPRIGALATMDAPALLFVNTGRRFDSEGTLDTPDRLERAMVAQLGDTMLRLARRFGDAPLARGVHSAQSWFTLPSLGLVQHPAILSWGLAALAWLMLVRGYHAALGDIHTDSDTDTTVAPLVQGFFGMGVIMLATRMGVWERREELGALTRAANAEPALVFAIIGTSLFVGALYGLRRLAGAVPVFLGTMAWLAVVLVVVLLVAPDAAYVLAWPLVGSLAAFMVLQAPGRLHAGPFTPVAALALVLVPALALVLALFLPALGDAWNALAPQGLYVPAAVIAIMLAGFASLLLLLPIGRYVGAAVALALAGCLALPGNASAPAPQEQAGIAPNRLVYFKDMNSWRAYWLQPPQPLDAWSRQLFPNLERPAIHVDVFGWHSPRQWYAIAPREDRIAFPEAFILRSPALAQPGPGPDTSGVRQVEFTLRSKNRAPHIELWAAGTKPLRSTVNGRVLTSKETGWSLSLYGMEDQLLRFTIDAPAEDLLAVVVEERMPGLPEHLLPPGAPARMAGTGMTISSDVLRFY